MKFNLIYTFFFRFVKANKYVLADNERRKKKGKKLSFKASEKFM